MAVFRILGIKKLLCRVDSSEVLPICHWKRKGVGHRKERVRDIDRITTTGCKYKIFGSLVTTNVVLLLG